MPGAVARGKLSARISSESAEIRVGKATSPLGNAGQSKKHGAHSELGGRCCCSSVAASGEGKEADRGGGGVGSATAGGKGRGIDPGRQESLLTEDRHHSLKKPPSAERDEAQHLITADQKTQAGWNIGENGRRKRMVIQSRPPRIKKS